DRQSRKDLPRRRPIRAHTVHCAVTMVTSPLAALAVVLNAIAAGALLGSTVGPVPLLLALPPDGYIRAKQFLTPRYDPAMPIVIVATTLLDAALVFLAPGSARFAFAGAVALLVLV